MFVDAVTVSLRAGDGGNGVIAWRREKYIPKGGPTGGDGGKGGSIFVKASPHLYSLDIFRNRKTLIAENGVKGGINYRKGRDGNDLFIEIPCGTLIKDAATKEVLYDITNPENTCCICRGGKGGRGNARFKSSTRQAPYICTPGEEGEVKEVEFELKLIADVGLIGMPNAGKSTLLAQLANTELKIGAYPFTTLSPNVCVVQSKRNPPFFIADIPGLIEGAHRNKGLGISFLKHVERSKILVFVIDISGQDGRDPYEDFLVLQEELRAFREDLLQKPFLIALNKIDQESAQEHLHLFQKHFSKDKNISLVPISAAEGENLPLLLTRMQEEVAKMKIQATTTEENHRK